MKHYENYERERNVFVGFRVTPEENEQINKAVALSGLLKREYCYLKCTNRDVVVQGNPRVYKALKIQLNEVLNELRRIESGGEISETLLDNIRLVTITLYGLKEEND